MFMNCHLKYIIEGKKKKKRGS